MMEKELLSLVKARRSTRQFSGEHISDETVQAILEIAAYAPSSKGRHPMEFVVIRDKHTLEELGRCKAMGAGPLPYSDVAIVPVINRQGWASELWIEDAAIASAYILLAAEAYGVGACWIHMRDRKGHTGMAEEDIRALLGIPDHYNIVNAVSLGVKKEPSQPRELEAVVHYERFDPERGQQI